MDKRHGCCPTTSTLTGGSRRIAAVVMTPPPVSKITFSWLSSEFGKFLPSLSKSAVFRTTWSCTHTLDQWAHILLRALG